MKTKTRRWAGILFAAVGALLSVMVPQSRAEYGVTNIINGNTINYTGTWKVGANGSLNAQIITNGGILAVVGEGIIGYSAISSNNYAIVTGSGSLWNNSGKLYVGFYGSANQLTIQSGVVSNSDGYIGTLATASNNSVLVSGTGSLWNNGGYCVVGFYGSANQLTIQSGGVVNSSDGFIGSSTTASNNSVLVSGTGSLWNNAELCVGNFGSGNQLTIQSGGVVNSSDGFIGSSTNANNNSVLVSGTGSLWNNSGKLYVGNFGSSNQLTIQSGVVSNTYGYIGYGTNANNNCVLVSGTGSVWTNTGMLYVGYMGSTNRLVIADGAVVWAPKSWLGYGGGRDNHILLCNGTLAGDVLMVNSDCGVSGWGMISGAVTNMGTLTADGGALQFQGNVKNTGVLRAVNGAVLESYGPVVNDGVIDIIYGNTNFHSTFINNGIVLTADGDPDGDGMSNLHESLAGTSPTNSASCLRITNIAREGDDVRITWTAVGGKSYVVQTNSLLGGGYGDFSGVIYVPGTGESLTNYVHFGGATNNPALFYRIRLWP